MPSVVSEFHEGEREMHSLLKVPPMHNPTAPGLPPQYGMRVMQSSLLALGTLDEQGRPWTTVWGGERGFARPIAQGVLGINNAVDTEHDPVFRNLWGGGGRNGEVVRPGGGRGKEMSALAIDLKTRDRVKLAGKMIAGAVVDGRVQMAMVVEESLGNCPKYLNKKEIVPHEVRAEVGGRGLPLGEEAVALVRRADTMFVSSGNGSSMDTNIRGGPPGFVRVVRNDEGGVELIYPEYSGNRLYQTLGNLKVNPLVGIAIPDFNTSNVLHLTGTASILLGQAASSLIAKTNLAVKITLTDALFLKNSLPFHGDIIDYSPYNPPVRPLLSEHQTIQLSPTRPNITAKLTKREVLAPSINRFTFQLDGQAEWAAGQYVTLDFEPELGAGYAHMNDSDPQSLNDDYVRTFTVSSPPEKGEMQITARKHGPVTGFLWKHNLRVPLEIPVLGFGGEEAFRISRDLQAPEPVFVAAGVGITPLLAQASALLAAGVKLRLLWSLRVQDIPFAVDTFQRIPGLEDVTRLFVTGEGEVEELGAEVVRRRIEKRDVTGLRRDENGGRRKFFLCLAPGMLGVVTGWLDGELVVWEEFGY